MGKKKKGGKGKGKKEGGDGKLPPPPKFDDQRQGAYEALLAFRIRGKEELVDDYQEDAEVLKEKNYSQQERNYHLKVEQTTHYQTLVQQAKRYDKEMDESEKVDRETVDAACTELHQLARRVAQTLKELEERIVQMDEQIVQGRSEVETWTTYKDTIQHEKAQYISEMKTKMEEMKLYQLELQKQLEEELLAAKQVVIEKTELLVKKQKESITESVLQALDKGTRGELADNAWLHKQIKLVRASVAKMRKETEALEQRNLQMMSIVTAARDAELETTREVYLTSTRKSTRSLVGSRQSGSTCDLPSLVDVGKCTSDQGPGGQVGQLELKMLSVQGSKALFNKPPDTVHLPPIEEQQNSHSALPKRTKWPISYSMLKSVVS